MNELSKLLQENLNIEFISATLSNSKKKDDVQKVKVRPVLKKEVLYFQFESFRNNRSGTIRHFTRMWRRKKLVKYFSNIWEICARCRWRHRERIIRFL